MSTRTDNPFSMLSSDEPSSPQQQLSNNQKESKKNAKPNNKPAAAQQNSRPANAPFRGASSSVRGSSNRSAGINEEVIPHKQESSRGRGTHGGRGRGRGHGQGLAREFDRHSYRGGAKTGQLKKGGSVALGDSTEVVEADPNSGIAPLHHNHPPTQGEQPSDAVLAADAEDADPVAVSADDAIQEIENIEPEPLSFEEYQAQQVAKKPVEDLERQVRQVEIDEAQWNKVKPLESEKIKQRSQKNSRQLKDTESAERSKVPKRKVIMNIDEFVAATKSSESETATEQDSFQARDRPNSGRGRGRGAYRGGRGTYRGRGRGYARGPAVNVGSEADFPKLG